MLYKYKSIRDFKYLLEILVYKRLYAAKYSELNDPMEGQYQYNTEEFPAQFVQKLKEMKENLRICSLSDVSDNLIMWSHYADGHSGVVFGIEVDDKTRVIPVNYYDEKPAFKTKTDVIGTDTAIEVLSQKHKAWSYEREQRIFTFNNPHVSCSIKELILGAEISRSDESLIRGLLTKFNTEIEVSKADLDTMN